MGRPRERDNLGEALQLNVNILLKRGLIAPNAARNGQLVWRADNGQPIAHAFISSDLKDIFGCVTVALSGRAPQRINLIAKPRFLGGVQWYALCPSSNVRCSILWSPPDCNGFFSRHAFDGKVAYPSQFADTAKRAELAQRKTLQRLERREKWDGVSKPRRMHHKTYARLVAEYDRLDNTQHSSLLKVIERTLQLHSVSMGRQ